MKRFKNNQECFDFIYKAVVKQNEQCLNDAGNCSYIGPNGTHCAAGFLLNAKELQILTETSSLSDDFGTASRRLLKKHKQTRLIVDMQEAHDLPSDKKNDCSMPCKNRSKFLKEFKKNASKVAVKFGLKVPSV